MTKLNAFWRTARIGALGLAVAIVIGVAAQPAEARWHWNGTTYVWIGASPYYGGYGYYPYYPTYYPAYPAYPAYYGYGYGYPYYYGPSVGFSIGIH